MNWFRRLCLLVFGLSGLLALAALSLTWVGPWTEVARTLLREKHWYLITLEALVCIAGCGLFVCVLRALFTPRNPRETVIAEVDGGNITVTRTAIVSQTRHVIEADGLFVANSIHVRTRKRGHVRVHVKVKPRRPVDVVAAGEELYARLEAGLAKVCGQSVQSISIVFTEPEQPDDTEAVATYQGERGAVASEQTTSIVQVPAARLGVSYAQSAEKSDEDENPSAVAADVEVEPDRTESAAEDASVTLPDDAQSAGEE